MSSAGDGGGKDRRAAVGRWVLGVAALARETVGNFVEWGGYWSREASCLRVSSMGGRRSWHPRRWRKAGRGRRAQEADGEGDRRLTGKTYHTPQRRGDG